ncbi:SMI1/KNR4 family protein [Actinoplanes sp. GCM10030250]|uniref:SMI1/KNR4 family protein n=1 Tax=Actinoplanes sp. GCM10030250 TaxID=3273376 RepID=UPI003622B029
MDQGWPGRGPWVITATSAGVDWRIAAAALAAAAEVPVAAVVVGASVSGDDPARPHLAALLELPAANRLSLDRARGLVLAISRAYEVVLVAGPAGLLIPLGDDGWTLADLAAAVRAPAIVVTGAGTDAVNHTTLALGALAGHGIPASVVTIGEVDEEALPVTPAGRIPADPPEDFAGAADWLHPWLRANPGPPALAEPAPGIKAGGQPVSGRRVVLGLLAVFVLMALMACGLAWCAPATSEYRLYTNEPAPQLRATIGQAPYVPRPAPAVPRPAQSAQPSRQPPPNVCPENAGRITPTHPDAATTARVNKSWQRIEKWLKAHAPASLRALRPGAPASRIDDLQRRMSVAFPPDLVASLRRHDGASGVGGFDLPPYFTPESVKDLLGDWQVSCGVLAEADTSWANPWWDKAFVPFAADGSGGSLVVDQRPGGHGRVGEFYPDDGTRFEAWPASVAELLELTAASLESGRPYDGRYRPRAGKDGQLDWEIVR